MDRRQALEILRKLRDGIDPMTGEVFANDSPCQRADTVRALSVAVDRVERWRQVDLPANTGKPWQPEEEERLEKGHEKGRSVTELAKEHERTTGAIRARLIQLGLLDMS